MAKPSLTGFDVDLISLIASSILYVGILVIGVSVFSSSDVCVDLVVVPVIAIIGGFICKRYVSKRMPFQRELMFHGQRTMMSAYAVAPLLMFPILIGIYCLYLMKSHATAEQIRFYLVMIGVSAGTRIDDLLLKCERHGPLRKRPPQISPDDQR